MFSLNVPIPGKVSRLVADLTPALTGLDRVRRRPTLVVKRFGRRSASAVEHIESELRVSLRGTAPFPARIDRIDAFERPASGDRPVVYLAVESPGLRALHDSLCREYDPVPGIEADEYVPHVTLGRGSNPAVVRELTGTPIDPIRWTVTELYLWDATYELPAARIQL